MASLQIAKPAFASASIPRSKFSGSSRWFKESESRRRILRLRNCGYSRNDLERRPFVSCKVQDRDGKGNGNGEEPPESLFMKELKRRGMTPTSLLEDTKKSTYGNELEEERGFSKRNAVSTEPGNSLTNQREQSMALNSEGLEGLIPRAKLLLTLGGTFFLGFWPLILITVASFCALYLYFGPTFVHDASKVQVSPPQYVDPYALLEDERISQTAPRVN
ncbi:uncharacterized protein LOC115735634 isoform X1 [Rhodamnia argentea]|uniref:Uncharacterized protein LOC115735634 isoform X1 n=1 Tax=Rhodamnia argentea TaxID=178133 RepID=A0A8B8NK31_9MYRT|nr:uncharacterized protein LOC115735634 isoform X1 [Rhodamnia argentea]